MVKRIVSDVLCFVFVLSGFVGVVVSLVGGNEEDDNDGDIRTVPIE